MIRILTRRTLDVQYLVDDRALELEGVRDGPALWHPVGEAVNADEVLQPSPRSRTTGYDIIVAAPRPISALLAVGSEFEQAATVRAHREAVREALGYLNSRALVVHRQVLGEQDELSTRWSSSASFTHGINRAGEPHLHDHVIVGARGSSYPQLIDATTLREHASSADALYRSHLIHQLNATTSRELWRSFAGHEFVSGVDEGVRALWPGRASDRVEKVHWRRDEVLELWSRDLLNYHEGPQVARTQRDGLHFDRHAFRAKLHDRGSLRRRDVIEAVAVAHPRGASASLIDRDVEREIPHSARRTLDRVSERDAHRLAEIFIDERDTRGVQRSRERSFDVERSRER
jgi:hypothetical protein